MHPKAAGRWLLFNVYQTTLTFMTFTLVSRDSLSVLVRRYSKRQFRGSAPGRDEQCSKIREKKIVLITPQEMDNKEKLSREEHAIH